MSELRVPGFSRLSCLVVSGPWDGCICARYGYGAFRPPTFECGCCEMLIFKVCGTRLNFYEFSMYRNRDLDDRIYERLPTSMAAVPAKDVPASFLFMGDLNGHQQEWLGSTTTNRHGATVFGCDQLVIAMTHAGG